MTRPDPRPPGHGTREAAMSENKPHAHAYVDNRCVVCGHIITERIERALGA